MQAPAASILGQSGKEQPAPPYHSPPKLTNQMLIAAIHLIKMLLFTNISPSNLAMTGSDNILDVTYRLFAT